MAKTEGLENRNNKTITEIERDDQKAIAFKHFYKDRLIERGVRQEQEGHSLWKSQAQISKYLSEFSGIHLSAYEVTDSLVANDILGYLAEQVGGHFTPKVGELNGSTRDELSSVLKQASVITACEDDAVKCKSAWKQIARCAERALEELS